MKMFASVGELLVACMPKTTEDGPTNDACSLRSQVKAKVAVGAAAAAASRSRWLPRSTSYVVGINK